MKLHAVARIAADGDVIMRPTSALKSKCSQLLALQRAVMAQSVVQTAAARQQLLSANNVDDDNDAAAGAHGDESMRLTAAVRQHVQQLLACDAAVSIRAILDATRHNASGKNLRYNWSRDEYGRIVLQIDAMCSLTVALVRSGVTTMVAETKRCEQNSSINCSF